MQALLDAVQNRLVALSVPDEADLSKADVQERGLLVQVCRWAWTRAILVHPA
jgi:hypothetical protein